MDTPNLSSKSGYSAVNGIQLYFEIHGTGKPLVLIHGGGSTLNTSFGQIIPYLSKKRQVIAMDLQAHGRSGDRPAPLSFEQDARDVIQLLHNLEIMKADFFGFSNGGHTLIDIGLKYPQVVNKMIIASSFYQRDAAPKGFWEGFDHATLDHMPEILKTEYLAVGNDSKALLNMFNKDVEKMKGFTDWTDAQIRTLAAPTLIMSGNKDVGSLEHSVKMYHAIPNCELAILPGGHGSYIGTLESIENGIWEHTFAVQLIEAFLDK